MAAEAVPALQMGIMRTHQPCTCCKVNCMTLSTLLLQ